MLSFTFTGFLTYLQPGSGPSSLIFPHDKKSLVPVPAGRSLFLCAALRRGYDRKTKGSGNG